MLKYFVNTKYLKMERFSFLKPEPILILPGICILLFCFITSINGQTFNRNNSTASNLNYPDSLIYYTYSENGDSVVFEKYEFAYNEKQQLTEILIFKWQNEESHWVPKGNCVFEYEGLSHLKRFNTDGTERVFRYDYSNLTLKETNINYLDKLYLDYENFNFIVGYDTIKVDRYGITNLHSTEISLIIRGVYPVSPAIEVFMDPAKTWYDSAYHFACSGKDSILFMKSYMDSVGNNGDCVEISYVWNRSHRAWVKDTKIEIENSGFYYSRRTETAYKFDQDLVDSSFMQPDSLNWRVGFYKVEYVFNDEGLILSKSNYMNYFDDWWTRNSTGLNISKEGNYISKVNGSLHFSPIQQWETDEWAYFYYKGKILTHVNSTEKNSNIFIPYPNPVSEILQINLPQDIFTANFALYDVKGNWILSKEMNGSEQISLKHLPSGIYIYTLTTVNDQSTGKLIKK